MSLKGSIGLALMGAAVAVVPACSNTSSTPAAAPSPPISAPAAPAPPSEPACAYTVSPTTQDVSAGGGQYTVAITRTTGTCGWQASVSNLEISLLSTSGSGTDTLTYRVLPNPDGPTTRTFHFTVAWSGGSATVTVLQAVDDCGYTVSPTQQNDVLPTGEIKQFGIHQTGGYYCSFRWTSNADWITIVGGASGSHGSPTGVQYRIDANPSGTPRSGTLTLSWPTSSTSVTVTQFGACTYSISPSGTVDVPSSGSQFTVKMTRTLGACTWEASSYDFISVSPRPASGGDGGTFTVTVAPNSTSTSRFGCVSINLGFNNGVVFRAFTYTGITVVQAAPGSAGSSPGCDFRPPCC